MANLLVTGATGFIGANFVHYWRSAHPDDLIVGLDNLGYASNRQNLRGLDGDSGFEFVRADIRDFDHVLTLLRDRDCDVIVHFAAESHVDRSIHGPDAFIDINIGGAYVLLKAAKECWLDRGTGRPHRFHHVSTDEVYGSLGPDDPPFTESTPYAPTSPSGQSGEGVRDRSLNW